MHARSLFTPDNIVIHYTVINADLPSYGRRSSRWQRAEKRITAKPSKQQQWETTHKAKMIQIICCKSILSANGWHVKIVNNMRCVCVWHGNLYLLCCRRHSFPFCFNLWIMGHLSFTFVSSISSFSLSLCLRLIK